MNYLICFLPRFVIVRGSLARLAFEASAFGLPRDSARAAQIRASCLPFFFPIPLCRHTGVSLSSRPKEK